MAQLSPRGQTPINGRMTPADRRALPVTDTRGTPSNVPPTPSSQRRRLEPVDFALINAAALSALSDLLRRWLPDGREMGHEYVALNPTRADRHLGSFRICLRGGKRGCWADFATGDKGSDPISLAAYICRCTPIQAARRIGDALGQAHVTSFTERQRSEPAAAPPEPVAPQTSHNRCLSTYGHQLWACCRTITPECHAGRYLSARGCALPHPDGDLRWHPALKHPSGHVGPALVALVTDVHDAEQWLTLHRTWIAGDGSANKADVDRPRLLLKDHRKSGGCVRLWPDDWVTLGLAIGEGVETCLAAARQFTPIWSVIDAGNLRAFPVLDGVEALTIVTDHDPAGIGAALECGRRWQAAGREVSAFYPTAAGTDWADVESSQ